MLSHCVCVSRLILACYRIVTGNNTNNKSESDQEDNDDVNDNDWSYGAEKKGDVPLLLFYLYVEILNVDCNDQMKLDVCEITVIWNFLYFFYSQEKKIW